ncbi:MAG: bifunctional folylpolyglutamate synthase/dihydrofolate synthase [Lachnospiraceae bacterium]|nr:bifunctional folylpolyglutamate synthase/dihydrofolate synthase [Lachnospiraceae bacterium]
MTYQEAIGYIEELNKLGSVLGLDTTRELLNRIGNPEQSLSFVHVAGTNGKGSVCTYIESILREAGYGVGRYISPVIMDYREKIQFNGEWISKEEVAIYVTKIEEACRQMLADGLPQPTAFEVETAMSFLFFKEKKCDIVILETGMGGRMDSTNVIPAPLLAVITPIGRDHMQFLGNTIEEIAAEKAGIIKKGCVVVSAEQEPKVEEVLAAQCKKEDVPLYFVRKSSLHDDISLEGACFVYDEQSYHTRMLGKFQADNARLAILSAKSLRKHFPITDDHIRAGIEKAYWPGRVELLSKEPMVILDGAHNTDGAEALKETLQAIFEDKRTYIGVMGIFADKEYPDVVKTLAPLFDCMYLFRPNHPRGLNCNILQEEVRKYVAQSECCENVTFAYQKAKTAATKNDVIVIFGSLSFQKELKQLPEFY